MQEQERPDTGEREDLARSVVEGPGMEAPRDEVADKVDEGKAAAGGRLDGRPGRGGFVKRRGWL